MSTSIPDHFSLFGLEPRFGLDGEHLDGLAQDHQLRVRPLDLAAHHPDEGRCREMFRMKLEGKSFEQIRQALDARSINTIYTWDSRCRKKLLEKLGGKWEGGAS